MTSDIETAEGIDTTTTLALGSWIRLMQVSSPSLPTGSFAYSNGLETMVEQGWIRDESTAVEYLTTLLPVVLGRLDVPRLVRMHRAWRSGDLHEAKRQSEWLLAAREGREIQQQERQMASALRRWCMTMYPERDCSDWIPGTFAEAFARIAVLSCIDEVSCCLGYAYAWVESHANTLARLIPLGPMAAQRVLGAALRPVPDCITRALKLSEEEIGGAAPGLGLAAAQHETQYTRLFRS